MKYRQKKSLLKNQKFLALIGLAVLVLISFPIAKNISQKYAVDKEIEDLQNEIAEIEGQNKDLRGLIDYLESDQFVEEQARLNLGLKKEGEDVVVLKEEVVDNFYNVHFGENEADLELANLSNPERWWRYFFN